MNPIDLLKQARGSGYGSSSDGKTERRSFPLTKEELESVGDKVSCVKVYGNNEDGKFIIDRIEPETGSSNEDAIMVKNSTQPSPS
jgi:hypothetical protein